MDNSINEPAKPLFTDEKGNTGLCPTCSEYVEIGTATCPNCDQKLDWSEFE